MSFRESARAFEHGPQNSGLRRSPNGGGWGRVGDGGSPESSRVECFVGLNKSYAPLITRTSVPFLVRQTNLDKFA